MFAVDLRLMTENVKSSLCIAQKQQSCPPPLFLHANISLAEEKLDSSDFLPIFITLQLLQNWRNFCLAKNPDKSMLAYK